MSEQKGWASVKAFMKRVGRRNWIIAGAVVMIGAAVVLNWVFFNSNSQKGDGFDYNASAGMSTNYGTTMSTTTATPETGAGDVASGADSYFATVEVSRQRARDEALEVLNAVVENEKATEDVKAEAMAEIQVIAKEMAQESNIESILKSKGFAQCVAVISGENANIVVQNDGALQGAQLAQINAVVYEQAGIDPTHITIVQKSA